MSDWVDEKFMLYEKCFGLGGVVGHPLPQRGFGYFGPGAYSVRGTGALGTFCAGVSGDVNGRPHLITPCACQEALLFVKANDA